MPPIARISKPRAWKSPAGSRPTSRLQPCQHALFYPPTSANLAQAVCEHGLCAGPGKEPTCLFSARCARAGACADASLPPLLSVQTRSHAASPRWVALCAPKLDKYEMHWADLRAAHSRTHVSGHIRPSMRWQSAACEYLQEYGDKEHDAEVAACACAREVCLEVVCTIFCFAG